MKKSIQLNVPLVQQVGKQDCGIAALKMVLDYYGLQKSYEEVKQGVPLYPNNYGSNLMDLSAFAHRLGLENEAWIFDHWFMDENYNERPSLEYFRKLQEKIKVSKFKNKDRRLFEIGRVINLLKSGGTVLVKPLTKELIDQVLVNGNPILIICFSGILFGTYQKSDYHMVVIDGMDKDDYLLRDPNKHFNLEKINKDKLLVAHHQASSFGIIFKGVKK